MKNSDTKYPEVKKEFGEKFNLYEIATAKLHSVGSAQMSNVYYERCNNEVWQFIESKLEEQRREKIRIHLKFRAFLQMDVLPILEMARDHDVAYLDGLIKDIENYLKETEVNSSKENEA